LLRVELGKEAKSEGVHGAVLRAGAEFQVRVERCHRFTLASIAEQGLPGARAGNVFRYSSVEQLWQNHAMAPARGDASSITTVASRSPSRRNTITCASPQLVHPKMIDVSGMEAWTLER
jgi:hypothetical protein